MAGPVPEGTRGERLRALVVAAECSPAKSHTAGSAWQIVSRVSAWHDLWVIAGTHGQHEVEECLARQPELPGRLHFAFVPLEPIRRGAAPRPVLPVDSVLRMRRWQAEAYGFATTLHKDIGFDVVHQLRGDSFREPGFCWKLPIPFVWGPTGGNTGVPWKLMGALDARNRLLHCLRNAITAVQLRFSPRVRHAAARAAVLLAQTSHDQRRFAEVLGARPILAHEQAAEPGIGEVHHYDGSRPLRLAWVGRCEQFKALHLVLDALARPGCRGRAELHVVGDGRCRAGWQRLAARLGVADWCVWHGWLDQKELLTVMGRCDALVFSSLLEATSTTVMQALSLGLPVVCMRHCGYGDVVDQTCGILVEVARPAAVVEGFAAAFARLAGEPPLVEQLSRGALEKARAHSWDHLAGVIRQAYEDAARARKLR